MIFGTLSFDLKDAIDIILVALLLFYIYRLMRASSSSNIFTGVLVFIIVWIFVSQFLKMRLLGSIFDRLINVGALALIVLFQEEIRQFFSSIGTQRARSSCVAAPTRQERKLVSRRRHGARIEIKKDRRGGCKLYYKI